MSKLKNIPITFVQFVILLLINVGRLVPSDDEEGILDRIDRKFDSKGRPIVHRNTTMNLRAEKTLKRQKSKKELEILYDDTGQKDADNG